MAGQPPKDSISIGDINLVEHFLGFLKSKKLNEQNGAPHLNNGVSSSDGGGTRFRDKLLMYFGEFLPSNVVDDLCSLVDKNSYGKCSFCLLPTESLVLSVLQILLDASKSAVEMKEGNVTAPSVFPNNRGIVNDKSVPSMPRDIRRSSSAKQQPNRCSGDVNFEDRKPEVDPKNVNPAVTRPQNLIPSKGAPIFADGNSLKNPCLILDTPIVMHRRNFNVDESGSAQRNVRIMNKKPRIESPKMPPDVEVLGVSSFKDRCMQLGKLNDDQYNIRNLSTMAAHPTIDLTGGISRVRRFVITDEEKAYYNILCGLAYSQWSCMKAVEISRTSVTYCSLGQSIEPQGKVDNFFIAVMCRKFFEDQHPRESKKHYFFPKVGGCLYTYNCTYDMDTIKNCFVGANSAHKLHLSDKLLFPIIIDKHWFVFIVDLKNKHFVFLDSYCPPNHKFQVEARNKLIPSFKNSWYEHAGGRIDLEEFTVFYPPVPRQSNVFDCGIFVLKYMELWTKEIDLRDLFDESDIPNIRVKLGVELFFNKANSVSKSLVTNLYNQRIDPRTCN